ncbi:DUF3304 domain-containing protein [Variovorax paradoxus]|uniref:DUF3304 domain-containing protein n=1 Tax=Variovorax paradoxus TaxID=34073 RepID=A0A5Q0M6M5_VARPD|nr:DUF3304 domain-containing protein [Variovorax paradoxus]QFZ84447.1 DUF3304 domain-containing protein [Variovorax paradoxus]
MTNFLSELPHVAGWLRLVAACLLLLGASGCEPQQPKPPEPMIVGITGYNFTSEGVQGYSVNDHYGSNLPPYGGGGSVSCCVSLPAEWSPDLVVTVHWTMGRWTTPYETRKHLTIRQQIECCSTERTLHKTVPLERYGKKGGRVQVFFLPNDAIKVYVTDYDLGHEKHPSGMAYPEKPEVEK